MILHRLRLEHWRNVLDPIEVGPFDERLNVIHAENGFGKSSLFEAMRRTLFDAHNVSGKEIDAVRPWGRTLSPKVHVEFSQGTIRYRIEKTFLDGASARLLRFEDGKPLPIAENKNADAKLRELLSVMETPGRGLSKPEHWGLAQALWATQGAVYPESLSSSVTESIRSALGVQLSGQGSTQLEQLLEERYLSFFTKGGKARSGKLAGPMVALEADLDALHKERNEWALKHQQFTESTRAVEDARQKRDQARRQADTLREALQKTRSEAAIYAELTGQLEKKRQTEIAARERHEAITQVLDLIRGDRHEVANLKLQIFTVDSVIKELEPEHAGAIATAAEARRKRNDARAQQSVLDTQAAKLEDARSFLREFAELNESTARVRKLGTFSKAIDELKKRRNATVAPDNKTLRSIRKETADRDKADAALKASLIYLSVTPERDVTVVCSRQEITQRVRAGKSAVFSASPEVEIELKGFGMVKASGPEGDAENHRSNLEESKRKLEKLTQPFGTQDIDKLESLNSTVEDLDRKIEQAEEQLAELVGDDDVDGIRTTNAELQAKVRERILRVPDWGDNHPNIAALKQAFDEASAAARNAIRETDDALEAAQSALQGVDKRLNDAHTSIRNFRKNQDAAERRLVDLTKDGLSDSDREMARQNVVLEWEAARVTAQAAESDLKKIPDDPLRTVEKLERQLKGLETTESLFRDAETSAQTKVELLAAEGAYSKLAEIDEKRTDLTTKNKHEHIRIAAVQLLYETVTACRNAAVAAVAAPVELAATRMFSRVTGPKLGTIRLSDSFVPIGIHPQLATESVEIVNLSAGEQEQLALIIRLALGQVLGKNERQLVVLDDVLNATDTGRLIRMLDLLQESADRLQILILTCHPENYRALEGAVFHDLSAPPRG